MKCKCCGELMEQAEWDTYLWQCHACEVGFDEDEGWDDIEELSPSDGG